MSFDFLYSQPSFIRGMARAGDLWGTSDVYNVSASPETADALAMWADWKDTGSDLLRGASEVEKTVAQDEDASPAR